LFSSSLASINDSKQIFAEAYIKNWEHVFQNMQCRVGNRRGIKFLEKKDNWVSHIDELENYTVQ